MLLYEWITDVIDRADRAKNRDLLLGLFAAALTVVVYANSLGNGFTTDDPYVILNKPALRGDALSLFHTIDTTGDTQLLPLYRPVAYLTFLAEWHLHGFDPFLMHLANVLLHALNAFLVYRLGWALFNDRVPALLAALFFALHPLHSEVVNFLSGGRNTLLACAFILASYLLHRVSIERRQWRLALLAALAYVAGLFSKEFTIIVPLFIAAQEFTVLRSGEAGAWQRFAGRVLPYVIGTVGYLVLRWQTLSDMGIQTGLLPGVASPLMRSMYLIPDLAERLLNNVYIIPHYLLTVLWPLNLSHKYVIPQDLHVHALPLAAAWIGIACCVIYLITHGRSRATLFGLAWLGVFWLPVSGIVFFHETQMADRYVYISAIGVWIIVADQAFRFFSSRSMRRREMVIAVLLLMIMLSVLTVRRNADWKSDLTLSERLVEQHPDNPMGHYYLGLAYLQRRSGSDIDLAEREFEAALTLDPALQPVHTPIGSIRLERGDLEGALRHYSQALAYLPLDREARIKRAVALERLGRIGDALNDYRIYLAIPGQNNRPEIREYAEERIRALTQ